jgi:hypothetical protein
MLTPRKPDGERARPNKYKNKDAAAKAAEEALPEWDGLIRGPELPEKPVSGTEWSEATLHWWDIWRNSPQAMICSPTDWQAMLVAAEIHNKLYSGSLSPTGFVNMSAELRKIVGSVGGSFEDRKSLGLNIRNDADAHNEVTAEVEGAVEEAVDYVARMAQRQAEAKKNAP